MGKIIEKCPKSQYVYFGDLKVNDIFILSPEHADEKKTKTYFMLGYNALNHKTGKAEYYNDLFQVIKVGEEESVEKE